MKIGILASGRGSNFKKIAEAVFSGKIDARIPIFITNKKNAPALAIAKEFGIDFVYLNPADFENRESYDSKILNILKEREVELVCLAGYMRIVTPVLIKAYKNRILNIHPSLLPVFPGLHVQKKAVDYGVKIAGATVHIVDEGVDTGPIVIQGAVPVSPEDSEKTLADKILKIEHRIYPQAVKWFADNRVTVKGRKVIIKDADYSSLPVVPAPEDF